MSLSLWEKYLDNFSFQNLNTEAYRLVENQNHSSTRKLVDTLEEHEILEALIDHSKPKLPKTSEFQGLDYLLTTPFRYPPLPYGSRFGSRIEPSLWYGSLDLDTALAEIAFYRFYFILGSDASFKFPIIITLTSFIAEIATSQGIDLTCPPFLDDRSIISSPNSHIESQNLGNLLREKNFEAILYFSARRVGDFKNIALFTPRAFKNKNRKKNSMQQWSCITTDKTVEFYLNASQPWLTRQFNIEDFYVQNKFPEFC